MNIYLNISTLQKTQAGKVRQIKLDTVNLANLLVCQSRRCGARQFDIKHFSSLSNQVMQRLLQ